MQIYQDGLLLLCQAFPAIIDCSALELWANINLLSLKLLYQGILSKLQERNQDIHILKCITELLEGDMKYTIF